MTLTMRASLRLARSPLLPVLLASALAAGCALGEGWVVDEGVSDDGSEDSLSGRSDSQPCATSCDGCCLSDGTCVDQIVTDANSCGWGGAPCVSCGAGEDCSHGTCVTLDCFETCAGCCVGGQCFPGTESTACGTRGGCRDCTRFEEFDCQSWGEDVHTCDVDPDSLWDIVAVGATASPTRADGGAWDPFGGLPDLYLEYYDYFRRFQSSTQGDTLSASWDEEVFAPGIKRRHLSGDILVRDRDPLIVADDEVVRCMFYLGAPLWVWSNAHDSEAEPHRYSSLFRGDLHECQDSWGRETGTARFRLRPHQPE